MNTHFYPLQASFQAWFRGNEGKNKKYSINSPTYNFSANDHNPDIDVVAQQ